MFLANKHRSSIGTKHHQSWQRPLSARVSRSEKFNQKKLLKDNPLDRIRTNSSRSLESSEDCYSIVVHGKDGVQVVLPYSYLRGAASRDQTCVLFHSVAVVTVVGPPDITREMVQLLSRQRLAAVRDGIEDVTVSLQLEDRSHFESSRVCGQAFPVRNAPEPRPQDALESYGPVVQSGVPV
jgi:hypothetical protein